MRLHRSDKRDSFPANDPEWQLICRAVVDYAAHRPTRVESRVNWERFLSLIQRHRIQPLMATQLLGNDTATILPEAVKQALINEKRQNLQKILRATAELKRLDDLFSHAGIEYRILKGLPLAEQAYHHVTDRHSGDIDLLLPNQDVLPQAHQLLVDNGYLICNAHSQYREELRPLYFRSFKDNVYMAADDGLKLEVHWPSDSVPAFPEKMVRTLWGKDGVQIDCLGSLYRVPPGEELLDYLVWHGSRGQWFRLKWLVDVYLLLVSSSHPVGQRASAGTDVQSWRLTLQLLRRLFGYEPNSHCPPPPGWVEGVCIHCLNAPEKGFAPARFAARLSLRKSRQWRAYTIRKFLVHLPDYQRLSFPTWAIYATCIIVRPVCFFRRLGQRSKADG